MPDVKAMLKRFAVEIGRRAILPRGRSRVVILCYHSVSPTIPFASATPELFESHLMWLKQSCDVVSLKDIPCRASAAATRGRPVVAVTFDDGYVDNYQYAFPLLQRHGMPATFFLTAGLVAGDPAIVERFRILRRVCADDVRALEWSQVREMQQAGMEIGAHTYSHCNLARLQRAVVEAEVRRSKDVLEERVGEEIASMAYPYGKRGHHFNAETMDIVSRAGYERAVAVAFRPVTASHSRLALPRFFVTQDSIGTLREKVLGAWDLVGLWQEKTPLLVFQH